MHADELPQELHFINFIFKMGNYLLSKRATSNPSNGKQIYERGKPRLPSNGKQIGERGRPRLRFEDLPVDVIGTILEKLPQKEVVRTSVLSSNWRFLWTVCSKLSFDGMSVCGKGWWRQKAYCQKFINSVNGVLHNYQGKVVEEFEIRFEFDRMLVDHLNNWVSFAVLARTKHLAFDLAPARFAGRDDRYIFPFELLDSESIGCLQHIQLSFVSLQPPSWFRGFPNLRKLDLNLLHVTRKELENMLSNCHSLEWLSIVRCHLKDELMVEHLLPCLQYLRVSYCAISKIELKAIQLSTFIYEGRFVPIVLNHTLKLENAHIRFFHATLQHAIASLLHGLPNIEKLTLDFIHLQFEAQWLLENSHKFSKLRHIRLSFLILSDDFDKILYLALFMRAAPFIEILEVHFCSCSDLWFAQNGATRHEELQKDECKHLKNLHVTGYKGAKGQLEFILHVVENAPALEAITVDTTQEVEDVYKFKKFCDAAGANISKILVGALPPETKLFVL